MVYHCFAFGKKAPGYRLAGTLRVKGDDNSVPAEDCGSGLQEKAFFSFTGMEKRCIINMYICCVV
jgi:hypothetical protein